MLSWVNLLSRTDPRPSFCYANCFLGLTYGFLNKHFQEIKLFICHCSFITNVTCLETLQTDYSLACENIRFSSLFAAERRNECFFRLNTTLSWNKTEVLFLYMFYWLLFIFLFLAIQEFCSVSNSRISAVLQYAALFPQYRLNEVYCVCFPLFVYGFILLAE